MKVSFLSTADKDGGAARAAYNLAKGLRSLDIELSMHVEDKFGDDYWVVSRNSKFRKMIGLARRAVDSLALKPYRNIKSSVVWSNNHINNSFIFNDLKRYKPDIVNLHWVGAGFFPINGLKKINVPIVWSLHDMSPFTGGCHYDEGCGKFVESCGSCPLLSSGKFDLSRFNLLLKKKSFENYPITIVSPSKWLASKVKASKVLKGNRIEIIPNGTDLNTFKPMDKKLAREILNLEDRGRFILFGAMGGTTDSRKGFKLLQEALKILRESYDYSDIKLLIFGSSKPKYDLDLSFSAHYFGKIHDDTYLSILYSAADATITPSTQEAFGMVASESMACGTPVISFGATGSLDVIDHKINGYLAKPFEAEDLANGITWVLSNESRLKSLSRLSRLKCEKDFNIYDVSKKYQALYLDIIKNNS